LNGISYLEKSPLKYWMIAACFRLFGIHDWVARLPGALFAVLLSWLVFRIGRWGISERAGFYAGLTLATCAGLWLFTRIQIPDVILTFTIALAMWSLLRALDEDEQRPSLWASVMAASIGAGLLLKGLIAALFPVAAALIYLAVSGNLLRRETWQRLHPFRGALLVLLIAAPWHVLATLRNPPYFDLTMRSGPGEYHGFFWFYFINEHVLRFLNLRYPRDYNTVPRLYFWLLHLLWLFPWSVFFPAVAKLGFRPVDRSGRLRLMCLCLVGFILLFFTFSSTQEYYSMPCYPALALLLGAAMAENRKSIKRGQIVLSVVASAAAILIAVILFNVRNTPAPGDISRALTVQNVEAYTLSLGHMGDLTLASFAYLRTPLLLAGVAFLIGAFTVPRWLTGAAVMMVLFLHAARIALVTFDPYLSSRPLAEALNSSPAGQLILDDQYYTFSSVVFYTNKRALLLNGRVNNLEYGSYAPDAPRDVFINDAQFRDRWASAELAYLCADRQQIPRLSKLVGQDRLRVLRESGGKFLFVNQ
jgi:4-amino-4-deoxy-L-arabinose transferase-like glycosyltransferase